MNANHDDAMLELVSTYALGAIDAATGECDAVRAHLASCPICQEEYRRSAAVAAAIGRSAAEAPPPGLFERILGSLPSGGRTLPLEKQRRRTWFVPAAAAAAVILIAGIWWGIHRPGAQTWGLTCIPSASNCHAGGSVRAAGGVLEVHLVGLAQLPPGKQYQAWMIEPGAQPKPEPVFSPTSTGEGSVSIPEAAAKGAIVAITVEPAGGSAKPTTQPFLSAKIE